MFAALSPDRRFLTLAVVNATELEQKFDLNVSGIRLGGPSTVSQLTGADLDASDRVGQPPQVEIKQTANDDGSRSFTVAPISINIYRFPVAETAQ
jgi:alpha-N-arabinofuranosidase